MNEGPWTLDELVAEAAIRLSASGTGQASARTRDVPDRRTVRYYTSLGLLEGPREFRGKVGLYGERQVLQLLAIKHLQAQGEPLDAIQARLLGLSTRRLRAMLQRDVMQETATVVTTPRVQSPVLQGVALQPSITLMIGAKRSVTPDDIHAIEAASGPLVRLLRARNLID